jgi:hypothetical protein
MGTIERSNSEHSRDGDDSVDFSALYSEESERASLRDRPDDMEGSEQDVMAGSKDADFLDFLGGSGAADQGQIPEPGPGPAPDALGESSNASGDDTRSAQKASRSRLKGWKLSELATRPDPIWILENTIPSGLTTVYGPPKSTKTFWCVEIATCFAAGAPFHGTNLGKCGRVLYVAAEGGGKAIYNRIMAVARKRGIAEANLEANLEIVEHGMDLNNPESVDEFLKENPGHWDLLIIDTLARCMSGDENSTPEMNEAVAECDRIRRKAGGDLILVHHQGWAKARPRGASALFGALDALIRISRTPDRGTIVEVEALREGAVKENNGTLYRLVDGALESVTPKPKGVEKLRERERRMLELLEMLFDVSKGPVATKKWRDNVGDASPPILDGKSKKSQDQQWRRAVETLTKFEAIKDYGATVMPWLAAEDFQEEKEEEDVEEDD